MKKIMLVALAAGTFAFTSCSSDDDSGAADACQTCEMSMGGNTSVSEYCDNGDGTYTMTDENGTEVTMDLPEGMSFNDYIAAQESSGMITCN